MLLNIRNLDLENINKQSFVKGKITFICEIGGMAFDASALKNNI